MFSNQGSVMNTFDKNDARRTRAMRHQLLQIHPTTSVISALTVNRIMRIWLNLEF
jgi:hypothetical protein